MSTPGFYPIEPCKWIGKTGTEYIYYTYPVSTKFIEKHYGNYIYAKKADGKWVPIFIGEGNLSKQRADRHAQADCLDGEETTHIHVHGETSKEKRQSEVRDLLAAYPEAFEPTGCNVKNRN